MTEWKESKSQLRSNNMLNIPEEIKAEYLTDSVNKEIEIAFTDTITDVSGVNWYTGFVAYGADGHRDSAGDIILYCNYDGSNWDTKLENYAYKDYLEEAEYIYVSCKLTINSYTTLPTEMQFACHYYDKNNQGYGGNVYSFNPNDYLDELTTTGMRIYTRINTSNFGRFNELALYCKSGGVDMNYGIGDIQIESSNNLYSAEMFYNDDRITPLPYLGESIIRQGLNPLDYITIGKDPIDNITNEDIDFQNFRLQENLCSSDNLKFGACESSYVNFTVYGRNEDFKDRQIASSICVGRNPDVSDIEWINWYQGTSPAPGTQNTWNGTNVDAKFYGSFAATNGLQKTNLTYIKKYQWIAVSFKTKMNLEVVSGSAPAMVDFLICMVASKSNDAVIKDRTWHFTASMFPDHKTQFTLSELSDWVDCTFYIPLVGADYSSYFIISQLKDIRFKFVDANGVDYAASYGTYNFSMIYKDIQINIVSQLFDELPEYDTSDCLEYYGVDPSIYFKYYIPLGQYTVSDVKKSITHGLTKTEITAYDKLTLLEQNAMNWYTMYMYAYSTSTYQIANDFECVRQIYSSYFNLAKTLGIEKREDYTETVLDTYTLVDLDPFSANMYPNLTNKYSTWVSVPLGQESSTNTAKIHYSVITINNPTTTCPYVIDLTTPTDLSASFQVDEYRAQVDEYLRGVTSANIIIEEIRNNPTYPSDTFVVDSGDYFMLALDCTSINVYIPTCLWYTQHNFDGGSIVYTARVSRVEKAIDLTNAHIRLMYYGWHSKDIFPCDSSIKARDVVRSLLEPTGCLYRIDRYGMPDFVYVSKAGLYPSNTLFPDNDLYPREAGDVYPKSRYISLQYEDYAVQNIGRIQIVKKITSSDTVSICEWEYEGDPDAINTYLIDSNIFYSNSDMEYEYGSMSQVSEMLENMYLRIRNTNYTPHLTKALGLPWMEVGDRVGLLTESGGIESFIYRRTLQGIQLLLDTYEAIGDEYIEAVKDYGYKEWEG